MGVAAGFLAIDIGVSVSAGPRSIELSYSYIASPTSVRVTPKHDTLGA